MKKQMLYYKDYDKWDYVTIFSYASLTAFIYTEPRLFFNTTDWIFWYTIGTHLFLYFFNYKSLRKLNVWMVWIGFSLFHLYFYEVWSGREDLMMARGHSANGLQYTWFLLILFQGLQYISIAIQGKPLVGPSQGKLDIWNEREVTAADYGLFVVYVAITMLLNTFSN